jgi:hypothetical protein
MEDKPKNIEQIQEETFNFLKNEKGLSLMEVMRVRKAFAQWGQEVLLHPEIESIPGFRDKTKETYRSKKLGAGVYAFAKEEEVKLLNLLMDMAPEASVEKVLRVMGIASKLLDIETEIEF